MSKVLNANEICGHALRMVGAWPTSETAPLAEHLREALFRLDLIMAENAGVMEVFNLQLPTIEVTLTNGQQAYSLRALLLTQYPPNGIMFPIDASILLPGNNRQPLTIITRDRWDNLDQTSRYGVPVYAYMDRLTTDSMIRLWPFPAASDVTVYKLQLNLQQGAPNVAPAGVSGARAEDTNVTNLRAAWQRYMVYALACDLGDGAINKQPIQRLQRWTKERDDARFRIEVFENREHDNEPPIVDGYAIEDYLTEPRMRVYSRTSGTTSAGDDGNSGFDSGFG